MVTIIFFKSVTFTNLLRFTNINQTTTFILWGIFTSHLNHPHMKNKSILATLFLLIGMFGQAQKQEKYFYDTNWLGLKSDSGASFYRLFYVDECGKPIGKVLDYYITGELQAVMEGALSIDKMMDTKSKFIGKTIGYYKSGNRQFEKINDMLGKTLTKKGWFESGNLEWESKIDGAIETYVSYYEDGVKSFEWRYENDLPDGTCLEFYRNGNIKTKSEYNDGVLVTGKFIDCDEFNRCKQVFIDYLTSESNTNSWDIAENENFQAKIIQDEGYNISNKMDAGASFKIYHPIDITNSFSIESNVTFKNGDKTTFHGIQYAFLDWDNYSYFYISANGQFRVGHIIDGLSYGGAIVKSPYINPDKAQNIIKLSMYNNSMQYAVNGEIIFSEPFVSFKGNGIGFTVGGKSEVLFKNFIIKENMDPLSELTTLSDGWTGNGSGFFIDTSGVIATNYHVIKNAKQIEVCFIFRGVKKIYKANVISSDKTNDLAIIKIDDESFKHFKKIPYSFKNKVSEVGSSVFALGYPMALSTMGEEVKFTDGKISAKSGFMGDINTYQISVPIQPGNSGCPLFDSQGNVIGIINSKLTTGENVSYAIKSAYLNTLAETLPFKLKLPNEKALASKSLVEKIKTVSDYVVLIKTR